MTKIQRILVMIFSGLGTLILILGICFIIFYPASEGDTSEKVSSKVNNSDLNTDNIQPSIQVVSGQKAQVPAKNDQKNSVSSIHQNSWITKKTSQASEKENQNVTPKNHLKTAKTDKKTLSKTEHPTTIKQKKTAVSTKVQHKSVQEPAHKQDLFINKKQANQLTYLEKQKINKNLYWIQLASYFNRDLAQKAVNQLFKKGTVAHIYTVHTSKGTLFQVKMGPYPDQRDAQQILQYIQKQTVYKTSFISHVVPN